MKEDVGAITVLRWVSNSNRAVASPRLLNNMLVMPPKLVREALTCRGVWAPKCLRSYMVWRARLRNCRTEVSPAGTFISGVENGGPHP